MNHRIMNWNERVKGITTDGVFIPGFSGIASPYWKSGFKDILINLDGNINQTIRAAMESIGLLTNDILICLKKINLIYILRCSLQVKQLNHLFYSLLRM